MGFFVIKPNYKKKKKKAYKIVPEAINYKKHGEVYARYWKKSRKLNILRSNTWFEISPEDVEIWAKENKCKADSK